MPFTSLKPRSTAVDAPPRRERQKRGAQHINLEEINRRLLNALSKESISLMNASYSGKLDRDASTSLKEYLKLMKELRATDKADTEKLSDADLAKAANKGEV